MTRSLLTALIVLSVNILFAQNIKWNSAPQTGFVFQITNLEAQKLLTKSRPDTIINAMLHTQVDTFNVQKGWNERPEKGHFIMARIIENKLHCEYTSVFPYQVLLLQEYEALSLQILDLEGNVRSDAKVKFKTRRIDFDQESNTYRIEHQWFNRSSKFVTVELDGFLSVFNIEKHDVPSWSHDYYRENVGPDFYSYMITDKNKYKPGELVRFKSYALTGSRHPIRRDLDVYLVKSGSPHKIGTLTPHRPGSFVGEIRLADSLRLTLDQNYYLQLREKNKRVVANCSFKYEDYELHGNKLEVELETLKQFHPASNSVKIKATSENGLTLKDARATVMILTESIRETFQPLVILKDTLFKKDIILNGEGITSVEIPSSLFQKTNTAYYVQISVLNSENQRMERTVSATHYYSQYELTASFSNDSIMYQVLNNGEPMANVPVKVYRGLSVTGVDVTLPLKEKINPAVERIKFESNLVSRLFQMANMLPKIKLLGGIEKDSFNISVQNPQNIQISWYIYQGSVLVKKGFDSEVEFKSLIEDRTNTFYVELLYSFGGDEHIISNEFLFNESSLDIALNIPDRVYPGQTVDAVIEVTDELGKGVAGVDLTALATTAKLDYYLPDLPYYGSTSNPRSAKATYSKEMLNKRNAILELDYSKWVNRVRLDTMKYYQFIYPGQKKSFYSTEIADSTQFAPYVMQHGLARNVYVIEVDRMPMYYSWTKQPKGYSFYVQPEKLHQVTLRLHDRVLILDSMCFDTGKKTVFSFDLDHLPKDVIVHMMMPKIVKLPGRRRTVNWVFTEIEQHRIERFAAGFNETTNRSYLTSENTFVPVSYGKNTSGTVVVGPINEGKQTFTEYNRVSTTYRHNGAFSYEFEDNIVYKLAPPQLFPEKLFRTWFNVMPTINDVVLTKEAFLEHETPAETKWHPRTINLLDHACRVNLLLPFEETKSGVASVLFQHCKTNEVHSPCRNYNTTNSDYYAIPRGCYRTIVLYNDGSYLKTENTDLQSYSNVVADMRNLKLNTVDSLSRLWLMKVAENCYRAPAVTRTMNLKFSNPVNSIGNVHGTIYDESNSALPGVNVVIKGTTIGTVTDENGRFMIDILDDPSILMISFIGYTTQEVEVRPGSEITVVMEADVQSLSEIVVVGYGTVKKSDMTGAVSSLQGRVAGVSTSHTDDADKELEEDDTQSHTQPDMQQRAAEEKMYQELMMIKNIRSLFSDVGFWEPRLFTDRQGKSTFKVTFPDDITRWDAVVFGMNRQLQTGTARKSIKSYKPLMAELLVPQFLTVGDSSEFLGKVSNYTNDKMIHGKVKWPDSTSVEKEITFDSYHAEKIPVVVTSSDSITTSFSFTRDDGYFDGEERTVPVVDQGTIRANGTLSFLKNNEELYLKAEKGTVVKMEIFDNPLDIFAGDVRYLLHYTYDCNEQLASKLFGLLDHKLLMQYEGKPFEYDSQVNKIILRLLRNQNSEFLWSWWDLSPNTSHWMSAHILRALKAAKDAGYFVNLDLANIIRKATYQFEFEKNISLADVQIIHALATWGANIDYAKYVRVLDKHIQLSDSVARNRQKFHHHTHYSLLNEKLLLLEVRQLRNLPLQRDSLTKYQKKTILNEVYFDDGLPKATWYTSDLVTNTIAYRIVKRDSVLRELTMAMQMYFLSLRREGSWNTYEASNVLMSILPDLIAQGSSKRNPAIVALKGVVNASIQKFPYKLTLIDGQELNVRKESGMPLYCMQYVEERVTTAHSGTDAFKIKTGFTNRNVQTFNTPSQPTQHTFVAGVPFVLKCTIEVKRDAKSNHVMIEIPIPGGCSYADKRQFDNPIETHREYFKEKTVVFCESMTTGTYVFQIQLLPRFTGSYYVNPAQVSLMYFPVINANTDLTKVEILD